MSHDPTWTARFRFRIAKRLRSDEKSLAISIGEHTGTLYAEGETLKESQWLYITLPGFMTDQDALAAAARLKVALMVATIERGNGIDPGEDKSTGGFTRYFIENFVPPEIEYLNDVHGVQVYRYDGRQHFISINANLTVTESPEMLLSSLASVHAEGLQLSEDVTSALETLSLSRLADHPLAEATLCIAAVELLARRENWTADQRRLLKRLERQASEWAPDDREVAEAIGRAYKSVRGGVRTLVLDRLGLGKDVWKQFDHAYALRSTIFHSLGSLRREAIGDLATAARSVCQTIVLAAARKSSES